MFCWVCDGLPRLLLLVSMTDPSAHSEPAWDRICLSQNLPATESACHRICLSQNLPATELTCQTQDQLPVQQLPSAAPTG
jgi:hypothetical protein